MISVGYHHYVPALKWKQGEQRALGNLDPAVKARLTPLIEIVVQRRPGTGALVKTVEHNAASAVAELVKRWGIAMPFLLDAAESGGQVALNGQNGAKYLFDAAQASNLRFVPVVGLGRDPAELHAARSHAPRGLCLRLTAADITSATLNADIHGVLGACQAVPTGTDLIIDLGSVEGQNSLFVRSVAATAMGLLPVIHQWRTLTLLASAFPSKVASNGVSTESRTEWHAWLSMRSQRTGIARLPLFGDYGIQHPDGVEGFDPRFMTPASTIRYTLQPEWHFLKGVSNKIQSSKTQFPVLARQLASTPSFMGAAHCPGCTTVQLNANGTQASGSLTTWREVGTSHHLTLTTQQLAGVPYP